MDYFITEISAKQIRQEKDKARELRRSRWWNDRVAKGLCHYCGAHFPPTELTMDHVVPIARGGKSSRGNLVPACKECNNKKKYLLPIEWDEYLESMKTDG
jgi:5-methylcytosine-specific restriction endonuclease McrA